MNPILLDVVDDIVFIDLINKSNFNLEEINIIKSGMDRILFYLKNPEFNYKAVDICFLILDKYLISDLSKIVNWYLKPKLINLDQLNKITLYFDTINNESKIEKDIFDFSDHST